MHLVYPVREGANEHLRYSLRSAEANFQEEIESVWIVGGKPEWVKGVNFIPGNHSESGHRNVFENILLACEHVDIPEEVVMMNDDFFVLDPTGYPVMTHRTSLESHIQVVQNNANWWLESLLDTRDYLAKRDIKNPLSFELHRPFPVNTQLMAKVLREAIESVDVDEDNPPQWRTLYGNLAYEGKKTPKVRDGKIYGQGTIPWGTPFVSTSSNRSFGRIKTYLKYWFPESSTWEQWPI